MNQAGSANKRERKTPIKYMLMDPAGNRTILVETPVAPDAQPAVAARLMKLEPSAEQVGFVTLFRDGVNDPAGGCTGIDAGEKTGVSKQQGNDVLHGSGTHMGEMTGNRIESCDLSLRMAGGEFCGNASMSAAVWYGMRSGMDQGTLSVEVSGSEVPVKVTISSLTDGLWQGIVEMPGPESVKIVRFRDGQEWPVVSFFGISHVILEKSMNPETAASLVKEWCGFLQGDALGLLFLDRKAGRLTPLVYVPAADTLFWESACGSGTTAVGAWLAQEQGRPVTLSLQQPGGMLEISASPGGPLLLKGKVRCMYEQTAEITFGD